MTKEIIRKPRPLLKELARDFHHSIAIPVVEIIRSIDDYLLKKVYSDESRDYHLTRDMATNYIVRPLRWIDLNEFTSQTISLVDVIKGLYVYKCDQESGRTALQGWRPFHTLHVLHPLDLRWVTKHVERLRAEEIQKNSEGVNNALQTEFAKMSSSIKAQLEKDPRYF